MEADVGHSFPVQIHFSVYPLKTERLKVLEYKLRKVLQCHEALPRKNWYGFKRNEWYFMSTTISSNTMKIRTINISSCQESETWKAL